MKGIQARRFSLSGRQLLGMDENERVLFVQLSHVGNSIGILQKWMLYMMPKETKGPQYLGALTQQMLAMRMLAGTLNESWEMLRKSFFGTKLSAKYKPMLDPESKEELQALKRYFGAKNLIRAIRNLFAFHVNRDHLEALVANLDPAKKLPMIIGENHANCLFWVGEEIGSLALLSAVSEVTGETDAGEVLDSVYRDVTTMARSFSILISGCLIAMLKENIPQGVAVEELEIAPACQEEDIAIPYFVSRR